MPRTLACRSRNDVGSTGPGAIRPALQRAWTKVEEGTVGVINVKAHYRARATTERFSSRET